MAEHFIDVSLVPDPGPPVVERVLANPNPLPRRPPPEVLVRPGDTVTWRFDPATVGARTLRVEFRRILDLDPITGFPTGTPQTTGNLSSFIDLQPSPGQIRGTIRPDVPQVINQAKRFVYKIVVNGVDLEWINGVPGGDVINGGGIDIPRTPP